MMTARQFEDHFSYANKRNYGLSCAFGLAALAKLRFFWKGPPVLPPYQILAAVLGFVAMDTVIDSGRGPLKIHE